MKTRFRHPHRARIVAASIALAFAVGAHAQDAPPQIIDQGNGWQLVSVPTPADAAPGVASEEPAPILLLDSAQGLQESPLPESIKLELAPEFSEDAVSLAVHYDVATAIAAGTAAEDFAAFIEPDEGEASIAGIGCDTGWRHRTRSFERSFSELHYDKDYSSGGFTGELNVDVPVSGTGTLDVEWAFKKTSFCLPWTAKFVSARARGNLDIGDSLIEATGTASYTASDRHEVAAPEFKHAFMVGPIPLVVGAEFPMGIGYGLEAAGSANVALRSRAQGEMVIDMTCTREGCDPTPGATNTNTVTFDDLLNPTLQASASLQVDFKPYAYLEARGFLYHQDIASAGLGAELSLPTRLFYYAGNACGNGSGGSGNEAVNGGYINVGAQLEFYRNSTVFWDDHFAWLDSPVSSLGSFFREVEVDQFLREANEHTALRGELFFNTFQFGGGQHPLTPILAGNASVNMGQTASYTVSKRACVPMDAPLNYVISWGDGTANSVLQAAPDASASATHQFNVFGTQTVKAKITADTVGRSIHRETSRSITVNANAEPPVPGSMTVPASDPDGSFSVSWSSTVNTVNYRLYRRVNTGSGFGTWSQIDTVTGTSKALTAQPYGTVQYGVRACNTQGCSDTRTSNSLIVGIIPAAPTLTVTSMLCFGGNDVSWTAPSGASSYKLYWSESTNPANAGLLYEGPNRQKAINITSSTNLWVKACGTAGCGPLSAMATAHRYPMCK